MFKTLAYILRIPVCRKEQIPCPGYLLLCFYINRHAGLEFHREIVGEDGDLVDQPSYETLVKLSDLGCLRGNEVLQLFDTLQIFLLCLCIHQGLLFLIAQAEDLVCDGIVVLFVVRLFDEFLLQLLEAFVNAFRGEGSGVHDSPCDVFLHLPDEGIAVGADSIDGLQ